MNASSSPPAPSGPIWLRAGLPILLAALVFVAFGPALTASFVNWDDEAALLQTHEWRGLGSSNLAWMFTTNWMGPYQPLAWLSYAFDHAAVGLDSSLPSGSIPQAPRYHVTSVVLHALGALWLYFATVRLVFVARPTWRETSASATRVAAFVGAALFALHPLRVESVAWVTERRDVVAGLGLAAALWAWAGYLERAREPRVTSKRLWLGALASGAALALFFGAVSLADATKLTWGPLGPVGFALACAAWLAAVTFSGAAGASGWFAATAACFLVALGGKGLALVLPVWLLVLDAWPFGRIRRGHLLAAVLEKAPFWSASLVFGVIASWGQRSIPGALRSYADHDFTERAAQACFGLVFYVKKTLAPRDLAPLVGLPDEISFSEPRFFWPPIVLAVALALLVWKGRRAPALWAALVAYVFAIAPVLGFTQAGPQLVADRYSYFACLPFALLVASVVLTFWRKGTSARAGVLVLSILAVASLVPATRAQSEVWRSSDALWRHCARVEPESSLQLALFAIDRAPGLTDPADRQRVLENSRAIIEEASKLHPRPTLFASLARLHQMLWESDPGRRPDDARRSLDWMQRADVLARERGEWNVDYALNLGMANFNVGKVEEAIPLLKEYVDARPTRFVGRYSLGFALLRAGRAAEARAELEEAVALEPRVVNAWGNLGLACESLGAKERAIESYRKVLELDPQHPAAQTRLSILTAGG